MYTRLSHALTACVAAATLLILPVSGVAQTQANATAVQAAASTATATGIAPEATAAPKAHEAATNPYGLEALWGGSDLVAKTVLILLLIMSAGSWYILVVKLLEQAKMAKQARAAQAFWSAKTVAEGTQALEADSPFRFMADAASNAIKKHDGLMVI